MLQHIAVVTGASTGLGSTERMALSGQALIGAELGQRFDIKDIDGKHPYSLAKKYGNPSNNFFVPSA